MLGAEKLLAEPLESIRPYVEGQIWISISCHGTLNRAVIKALGLACTLTWKKLFSHSLSLSFAPAGIILTVTFSWSVSYLNNLKQNFTV